MKLILYSDEEWFIQPVFSRNITNRINFGHNVKKELDIPTLLKPLGKDEIIPFERFREYIPKDIFLDNYDTFVKYHYLKIKS